MDKHQAEERIQMVRDVMERSVRYTHFSGLSGVLSGVLGLTGCWITYWLWSNLPRDHQIGWLAVTWCSVLTLAIAQDVMLTQRKARASGRSIWEPATYQVMRAAFPGLFIALVVSLFAVVCAIESRLLYLSPIPGTLAVGYGVALCSAGMFCGRHVRLYGVIQLITGAVGLLVFNQWPYCLYQLALSFGVYQILFGLWLAGEGRQ